MRAKLAFAALIALGGAVAGAQAALPALFATAIAQTVQSATPYAYEVSVESQTGAMRYAVNPAASGAARVRALQPAENALSSQGRQLLQTARRDPNLGDIWCASARLRQARDVRLVREDAISAVFSFTPSAEQIGGGRNAAFAQYLRGEAVVARDSQDISSIRIRAPQAFRASIARVDAFDMTITCAAAPNGRRYGAQTVSLIRGSALTRQFDVRTTQRVTALRPAR